MILSSITFIFCFLPIFLLVYFLVPDTWKNACLLLGSILFYAYGARKYPFWLALIAASLLINYWIGQKIERGREKSRGGLWLAAGLIYNFGILFFYKFRVLPIGISFYSFQISSYLIEIYNRKIKAEHSLINLATYLFMFPKLTAGPIVAYSDIEPQLRERQLSMEKAERGLKKFTVGLGFKVLIANQLGNLWNQTKVIGFASISTPMAWLGILAFSLEIYFDFYGYSLMAQGLGEILGFQLPDNFREPYLAVSIRDFWRKWHITLGAWFRDYIYIPMGGSKKGMPRTIFNLFVVWMLTGLWHGIGWNYILWSMSIFLLLVIEKLFLGNFLQRHPIFGHFYLCFWVPITWLPFAVTDISEVGVYFRKLFPFFKVVEGHVFSGDFIKYGKMYLFSLLAGLIFCTGIPRRIYSELKNSIGVAILLLAVFWLCIYYMYLGMEDPFLYLSF